LAHKASFLNFGTLFISREWLKLETSNMTQLMLTTRGINEKCKTRSKDVGRRSCDLLL